MASDVAGQGGTVIVSSASQRAVAREVRDRVRVSQSGGGGIPYSGPYEVTPTAEGLTLQTAGLVMRGDLTVAPIPSDWGHVSWDGSIISIR